MATFTTPRNAFFAGALQQRASISVDNRGATSFKSDLQEVWEGAQSDRADRLEQTRSLQLAAQLLIQGESRRLAALSPDDGRAELLAAAAGRVTDRIALLDEEIAIAGVRVPMVKKTEALLNGRITDPALQAVSHLTVTLADEKGHAIPGVPAVETDSAGYYALVVPEAAAGVLGNDRKLQIVLGNANERVATGTPLDLRAGAIVAHDVGLSDAMLDKLKLRLTAAVAGVGREKAPGMARKRNVQK